MAEYHNEDTHFRVLDCRQCFEAKGRMCHPKNYEHDFDALLSTKSGLGICCKPDSTDDQCNDPLNQEQECSMKSFDDDPDSIYADVLSVDNRNYQMYAFCPLVDHATCGVQSDNGDDYDMRIYATQEYTKVKTNYMVYKPQMTQDDLNYLALNPYDDAIQLAHDFCHYQILSSPEPVYWIDPEVELTNSTDGYIDFNETESG